MRESALEVRLHRQICDLGGTTIRLLPTVAGMPDRMVLLPDGSAVLVELKTVTGRLRPAQRLWHQRSARRGWPVTVLAGPEEIDAWVEGLGFTSSGE